MSGARTAVSTLSSQRPPFRTGMTKLTPIISSGRHDTRVSSGAYLSLSGLSDSLIHRFELLDQRRPLAFAFNSEASLSSKLFATLGEFRRSRKAASRAAASPVGTTRPVVP